jgi:hypothetical protein
MVRAKCALGLVAWIRTALRGNMHAVHNARITLFATAPNHLGIGSIMAGIVAPVVSGTVGDFIHIITWVILGADLIALAQMTLGRLRT